MDLDVFGMSTMMGFGSFLPCGFFLLEAMIGARRRG
jgi:hypothetical protein